MAMQILSRKERERLIRRGEMFSAALELFSEKGYHNVSMHEIAAKAEFAIGTLYKFFKNKEDLYKALMMNKAKEYHRELEGALSEKDDLLATLRQFVDAKTTVFADNVAVLRLYFGETQGTSFNIEAGLDDDIRKLYHEVIEELTSVFKAGIRQGFFRNLDPNYMAVAFDWVTNAFLLRWLDDPERHPYEKNAPIILDMFLRGVLAK